MKIKIGFFTILLGLALALSHSLFALASLLAALTHELGHLLMARAFGISMRECRIGLYGAGLEPSASLYSYKREILLCLAGPLTNFLFAITLWILPLPSSEFLTFFIFSSFSLGTLNSLPIRGFDGGRILGALLSHILSPRTVRQIVDVLSFLFIFLLWSLSVYLLMRTASSLSLFVFSLSLFGRLFIAEP